MPLTKVTRSGITDDSINADKIEDGTIVDADITPGTITNAKLAGSITNAKLANSSITVNGASVSLGGSFNAGSISWQSVITADGSTTTTGVAGRGYFIDTTSNAHTLNLPSSASAGDTIAIKDYAGTFGTNNLTIGRNSHNIQGVANDSLISTNRASVVLVYIDATKGWLYTNESNVADLQVTQFTEATGGTVTTSGDFKIHSFTGDGCFVVAQTGIQVGCNGGPGNVDYLVVAGGGGGGSGGGAYGGGGGGAGGHRTTFPSPSCNAGAFPISAQTYPITVGGGGTGGPSQEGGNGSNSVFSTITSAGGGGGGGANVGATLTRPCGGFKRSGGSGGSGGGQGGVLYCSPAGNPSPNYTRGTGNTPPVSPSQGNPGGYTANPWPQGAGASSRGGGGGGHGSAGGNQPGGHGGNGTANSITGSPVTRAGGGGSGGSDWPSFPLAGGNPGPGGGGGGGGQAGDNATAGSANTGGGGGAGGWAGPQQAAPAPETHGTAGGKGIVIIRYKYQ